MAKTVTEILRDALEPLTEAQLKAMTGLGSRTLAYYLQDLEGLSLIERVPLTDKFPRKWGYRIARVRPQRNRDGSVAPAVGHAIGNGKLHTSVNLDPWLFNTIRDAAVRQGTSFTRKLEDFLYAGTPGQPKDEI